MHSRFLLIPEEREHHPRAADASTYSADEGVERERGGKGGLAFFTPSEKDGAGPSYVGPAPRPTRWQRWRAWWVAHFGR